MKTVRLPQTISEQFVILLRRHVQHRGRGVGDAGVGDHAVQPPEGLHRLADALRHRGFGGHIDHPGDRLMAECAQLRLGGAVLFLRPGPEHHIAALFGDAPREAQPKAAVAARHQRLLARQIEESLSQFVASAFWPATDGSPIMSARAASRGRR
jgi:hypothetical protein